MYFYKAYAFGFGGVLSRPYYRTIESQGSVVLSPTGGQGRQRLDKIRINNIVSAGAVQCDVVGSYDETLQGHACRATAVIEDLNIFDVITADRIVARVSSLQGDTGEEPAISVAGSTFQNLRIAGYPVAADLNIGVFQQYDTFSKVEQAYQDKKLAEYIPGSKLDACSPDDHPYLHALHEQYRSQSQSMPRWFSLVRSVQGLGSEISNYGSVIVVPDFGVIHLAELLIERYSRRLNMLRVQLGSPVEGALAFTSVEAGTTDIGEGRPPKGRPTHGGG